MSFLERLHWTEVEKFMRADMNAHECKSMFGHAWHKTADTNYGVWIKTYRCTKCDLAYSVCPNALSFLDDLDDVDDVDDEKNQ